MVYSLKKETENVKQKTKNICYVNLKKPSQCKIAKKMLFIHFNQLHICNLVLKKAFFYFFYNLIILSSPQNIPLNLLTFTLRS